MVVLGSEQYCIRATYDCLPTGGMTHPNINDSNLRVSRIVEERHTFVKQS